MIRVESLHIYPVKSCRGITVESAEVVATGFRLDRQWMVIGPDGGFLSQRSHPRLASVSSSIESSYLVLRAGEREQLSISLDRPVGPRRAATVWNDTCDSISEGTEAARWFSGLLESPCELVRLPNRTIRRVDPDVAESGDRVAFADGYPLLLISRPSVDDLNRRLDEPVPADRFRANIIVDGCLPYAEDRWNEIEIAEVRFRVAKPCARCIVVTTDQQSGNRSTEPLATLAGYRTADGKVLFGQNLIHRGRGSLRVGDSLRVRR
jgi:uncharacterized protein YcbX